MIFLFFIEEKSIKNENEINLSHNITYRGI